MLLQAQVSYASTDAEARGAAFDQWRQSALDAAVLTELAAPADFDRATASLTPGDMDGSVRISADLGRHAEWISEYVEMGFEEIYLHQVGRDHGRFLEDFGERVLPGFDGRNGGGA
jgi:alkanesulfonate monooxygenase SsuD/methylene tetrahydromethanopterin reductase-like flavin-dependent oxidoreductase (luciferase family)